MSTRETMATEVAIPDGLGADGLAKGPGDRYVFEVGRTTAGAHAIGSLEGPAGVPVGMTGKKPAGARWENHSANDPRHGRDLVKGVLDPLVVMEPVPAIPRRTLRRGPWRGSSSPSSIRELELFRIGKQVAAVNAAPADGAGEDGGREGAVVDEARHGGAIEADEFSGLVHVEPAEFGGDHRPLPFVPDFTGVPSTPSSIPSVPWRSRHLYAILSLRRMSCSVE